MSEVLRLADLSFEELEAAGFCECGVRLEDHPPQPARAPALSSPWTDRMLDWPTLSTIPGGRTRGRPFEGAARGDGWATLRRRR